MHEIKNNKPSEVRAQTKLLNQLAIAITQDHFEGLPDLGEFNSHFRELAFSIATRDTSNANVRIYLNWAEKQARIREVPQRSNHIFISPKTPSTTDDKNAQLPSPRMSMGDYGTETLPRVILDNSLSDDGKQLQDVNEKKSTLPRLSEIYMSDV